MGKLNRHSERIPCGLDGRTSERISTDKKNLLEDSPQLAAGSLNMPGLKRLLGALVILVLVFGLLSCESSKKEKEPSLRDTLPKEGDLVIPFKIKTLDGKEWSVDSHKGKPLVINFWASWCGPCRSEASSFEKVYLAFKETGVEFVGVAVQDNLTGAQRFVDEFKLTYPVGLDESGDIMRDYKIFGVPKTFIVGKDGRITFIYTGAISEEDLAGEIKKVL